MKKANVCIVIPLYKENPSELELKSVNRARQIFAGRDIFYVVPAGFNSSAYGYEAIFEFPTYYFQSLVNYSELCCLHDFYAAFQDYDYMMIYQPDCWVFEDSLKGLAAGRASGATVIGLATTLPRETIQDKADLVIDSFYSL